MTTSIVIGPAPVQRCRCDRAGRFQALLAGLAVVLAGCVAAPYDAALLRQAAELGQNQRWDEARPLIKEHLLAHPDDPVGHFYYGLSFLHQKRPFLMVAEGELLTAQHLLDSEERFRPEATDMDYETFRGVLHQKTALVYMRAFHDSIELDVPYDYTRQLLLKASAQVELGLKSDPDSPHLKEYGEFLRETLHGTPEQTPDIVTQAAGSGGSI